MSRSVEDELYALLESAGIAPDVGAPLSRYGALVLKANRRMNLTGAKSPETLAQHLLDSLRVLPYVREPYVDVGSGAGLPAIPIAIAVRIPITLIEATAKKVAFLQHALRELELSGSVIAGRAEVAGHDDVLRERFASGTARALAGATTVAELVLPFIAPGGVGILQRGRFDAADRRSLEDASLMLGGRIESEVALEGERRILLLHKEHPTPLRFPRRAGIPEKRPLCIPP